MYPKTNTVWKEIHIYKQNPQTKTHRPLWPLSARAYPPDAVLLSSRAGRSAGRWRDRACAESAAHCCCNECGRKFETRDPRSGLRALGSGKLLSRTDCRIYLCLAPRISPATDRQGLSSEAQGPAGEGECLAGTGELRDTDSEVATLACNIRIEGTDWGTRRLAMNTCQHVWRHLAQANQQAKMSVVRCSLLLVLAALSFVCDINCAWRGAFGVQAKRLLAGI